MLVRNNIISSNLQGVFIMKTKKLFASVIAVAGLFTCMAVSSASATRIHDYWSVSCTGSLRFTDHNDPSDWYGDNNANVNSCSYTYNSGGKATVSISAIEHHYTRPVCYISGESNNGGWTYFIHGERDKTTKKVKVKDSWGTKLYKTIDFETNSLCSRVRSTY